ncbi:MAG: bacillithiol system redox-active protein YtxJ [Cytophagales bacterium]|nr:bacillithiol system redox-active protein YtxJ [Bernardetiaceae bacterium]MDW8210801.1 bacillithiol system redox-active protein YtxJ [Cytophagales bacterium]
MNWNRLTAASQLEVLKKNSHQHPVLIFKHSTRCSISHAALNRLERCWDAARVHGLMPYYLDLIAYRDVSNQIANDFGVKHQSPQVLLIFQGKCIYHASHFDINFEDLVEKLSQVTS